MSFVLIAAIFIIVFLISIYKTVEVDITLKYYELFGKKVDELRDKVVWITGASSGIGENLAYELASVGCKLILSARRKQELERVKTKCSEIAGKKLNDEDKDFLVLPLDVTKFDTHDQAVQTVLEHFGQIDILVNNSGRSQRGIIINTEFKVDQELFELNVLGTISLTKVVLPHMIERNAGHIVVVSSLTGKLGVPTSGTYSATKHALQGYFYSLRTEVYDNGIDVSIVCPGPVKSAIVENSVSEKFGKACRTI
ncbi:dehydrogenase reductase SDR family member 7-like [Paramuricea clavata]|uniref:Dehydrogenase reductase SDR family member 7-like n=1 Tax=Paramuricea clavata TaxID=317549 RepID=A0A7D9IDU6_PARCT|nr:dehydrogenase reductase SDR family member 7-like [Paramuricea clavata]